MADIRPYHGLTIHQAIRAERLYQDGKWTPGRVHTWPEWFAILGDEVGEVANAVKQLHWLPGDRPAQLDELRSELIQVAAVAAAMVEQLDVEAMEIPS